MQDIKVADWSQEVAPFWGAVIKSALSTQGFSGLFKAGWTTIKVSMGDHWTILTSGNRVAPQGGRTAHWVTDGRLKLYPSMGCCAQGTLSSVGIADLTVPVQANDHACVALQGALVMPLMSTGFSMGLVKFNLITGLKS